MRAAKKASVRALPAAETDDLPAKAPTQQEQLEVAVKALRALKAHLTQRASGDLNLATQIGALLGE